MMTLSMGLFSDKSFRKNIPGYRNENRTENVKAMAKTMAFIFYVIGNYSVMFLLHKNAPRGCDQMQIAFQTYLCYTCTDGEFLQIMEESYGTKESDY